MNFTAILRTSSFTEPHRWLLHQYAGSNPVFHMQMKNAVIFLQDGTFCKISEQLKTIITKFTMSTIFDVLTEFRIRPFIFVFYYLL